MSAANFFKLSFIVSLLVAVGCWEITRWQPDNIMVDFAKYLGNTGSQISGTILGIVIAGLAILTSLSNAGLMQLFLQRKLLQRLLIPFWFVAALWAFTVGVGMVLYALAEILSSVATQWYIVVFTFFFCYSMCLTISLVGGTIQVSVLAAEYTPSEEEHEM